MEPISREDLVRNLEKYKEAIEDYEQAIKLNPKDEDYFYERGFSKAKLYKCKEGIKDFDQVIELNPK